jgi:hypothetical protein
MINRQLIKGFLFVIMLVGILGINPPVSYSMDALFDQPVDSESLEPVSEEQLDGMRGGYLGGLYFSVYFAGFWSEAGEQVGVLDFNDSQSGDYSIVSGAMGEESVTVRASVGGLNGAQGIFLITQVPGNFNIVQNNMLVQLAIINIADKSQLSAANNALSTIFGF